MQPLLEKTKSIKLGGLPQFKISALSSLNAEVQNLCNGCEREHFEILWIREGEGTYLADHSEFPLLSNSIFYGAPGHFHQLRHSNPPQGFIISFNEEFLHRGFDIDSGLRTVDVLRDFLNFTHLVIEEAAGVELNSLIVKMLVELESAREMKMDILKFYLRILMIHIRRSMDKPVEESGVVNRIVSKFLVQIEKDYFEKKSVSDYASMLCVTPNYLNSMVKRHTGSTAGFYIRRRIISEAKLKAANSDDSMKEIAYSLGFFDEAHFSKFFKNYIGMNFSEYKRMSRTQGKVTDNRSTLIHQY